MKTRKLWLWALLAISILAGSCRKEDDFPGMDQEPAPELTRKINLFFREVMEPNYYWNKYLPDINPDYEYDSKAYFKKLLYQEDKWSFVTDNANQLTDSFEGIEKSFGYSLAFGRFLDTSGEPTGNYFGIVEYVYPNTPASRAGFKRGDLITRLNGEAITLENYRKLLNDELITVIKAEYTAAGLNEIGTITLAAEQLALNPVHTYKIIEHGGHKIGYLFYTQYITSYNKTIDIALQYFKSNGVTDIVLDLRYNPGGQIAAAQHLCSSVAPLNYVNNRLPLVKFQWNDRLQALYEKSSPANLGVDFNSSVPVKMGLNRLYVLTGKGTASASELTITGLEPYMNIITVGDTTSGKYTASRTWKPADVYRASSFDYYSDFANWGVQPIIVIFANSLGVTNFKNGFAPDFRIKDQLLPAYPLGDLSEPLLRKAVEEITSVPLTAQKIAVKAPEIMVYDRGFSRFDTNKRTLDLSDYLREF
jgi:carboxyl-terminal processing protease